MNEELKKQRLREIYNLGRKAIGKSIRELVGKDNIPENIANKGQIGNLIQQYHFNIPVNSKSTADIEDANVELKVIPVKYSEKRKMCISKERMVLGLIDYEKIVAETFETSSLLQKNKLIEILIYEYKKNVNKLDFIINDAFLIDITKSDVFNVIRNDWLIIQNKIKNGRAHEISENDTDILSAVTKGENKNSVRKQPFSDIPAKQRAFALKQTFVDYLLLKYKTNRIAFLDEIFTKKTNEYLENISFENILKYFNSLKGQDISGFTNQSYENKSWHADALRNFLLLNNSKIFECLLLNNYKLTCRYLKKGKLQEEIGTGYNLEPDDFIYNNFEDSVFYKKAVQAKYIVVGIDRETKLIEKIFYYEFDNKDIEVARNVFKKTKEELLLIRAQSNTNYIVPNFIKKRDKSLLHIRPHAKNKSITYKLKNKWFNFTIQEFWINKNEFHIL